MIILLDSQEITFVDLLFWKMKVPINDLDNGERMLQCMTCGELWMCSQLVAIHEWTRTDEWLSWIAKIGWVSDEACLPDECLVCVLRKKKLLQSWTKTIPFCSLQMDNTVNSSARWSIPFVEENLGTELLPKGEVINYLRTNASQVFLRHWKLTGTNKSIKKCRNCTQLLAAYKVGHLHWLYVQWLILVIWLVIQYLIWLAIQLVIWLVIQLLIWLVIQLVMASDLACSMTSNETLPVWLVIQLVILLVIWLVIWLETCNGLKSPTFI